MEPNETVLDPHVHPSQRLLARENLHAKKASWIVVGGKMCSGKDTLAPLIQPMFDYSPLVRVGYGDLIRVEANQAIAILGGRRESADVLAHDLELKLKMEAEHAEELTEMLSPLVREPNHGVDASLRTDLMRKILVLFGSDWRTQGDPGYWSRRGAAQSLRYLSKGTSVYLTGGRFLPDVEIPQAEGARIIRLDITAETQADRLRERDGLDMNMEAVNDPSETALDDWDGFDVRVSNDGTLQEGLEAVCAELKKKELL